MRRFCRYLVLFIVLSSWLSSASAQVVNMPDANLRTAVRDTLDLAPNASITKQALQGLTRLDARDSQIKNLTGLEHATRLELLELRNNQVTDIRLLANLKNLKRLMLDNNRVKDIRVLVGMQQLTWLTLGRNPISDFTPLSNLTELRGLALWHNDVKDLTPLASMKKLTNLWLERSKISNITPLANLTNLKFLDLRDNQIRNVSLLGRLKNLETLWLRGNPIQDTSPLAVLIKLRDVDIEILRTPVAEIIPDPNLAAAVREALGLGRNARITKQAMQRLTELDAKERQIRNLTGLEQATQLTELELWRNQIRNLTPLANLTQLRHLGLDQNQISDIRPLTKLKQVESLRIGGNQIDNTGIRPLISLQQLKWLSLYGNQISNIEPLSNLTKLEGLWLSWNQIRDVRPLTGLSKLQVLRLVGNPIQDLSPLRTLVKQNPNLELDIYLDAGRKIEGPWVWMIAPTDGNLGSRAAGSGKDWLAAASGGSVTERHIATNGARAGDTVGNKVWTVGKIAPVGRNNITEMVKAIGLGDGNHYIEYHVAYGSLSLDSPRHQNTKMYVGSDDAVKVWLNGVLVHSKPEDRWALNYQDTFRVTLKQGRNILLVAVYNGKTDWSGFFGFENDAVYTLAPTAPERPQVVSIPDRNLAAAVQKALNLGPNARITKQAMQGLTALDARESQIKSLTGLQHATQLRGLELRGNQIRDIRPLTELKSLRELGLDLNPINNITPLANLTQLRWLLIGGSAIFDFTPLANLNQLEGLSLWGSNIGDVTLLANKTKLTHLWLLKFGQFYKCR